MQKRYWEEEILVVVSKAEEASLHDFCCKVVSLLNSVMIWLIQWAS